MFNRDSWKEIIETIRKNKLRTFLSGFTVALGILIFVVLFGLGNGLKNSFKEFFEDDATNVLRIFPGRTVIPYEGFKSGRYVEFTNSDIADIHEKFVGEVAYITPKITRNNTVSFKQKANNYTIIGVAPSLQSAEKTGLIQGRFINANDVVKKEKYAVIGRLVAKDLFRKEDALGQNITIGSRSYKVIGVFHDDSGDREERLIYIPYTTRQLIEKNTDKVEQIVVGFYPQIGHENAAKLEQKILTLLKKNHHIHPIDLQAISIRNVFDDLKQNQEFSNLLQTVVSFIGLGTLIAGIIGISNIMVYVVKERTKELGIRKAIGATPRSVVMLILQEAIFITTLSGYVGLVTGIALLRSMDKVLEDYFIKDPYVDLPLAIFATVVLIVFGAVAGYIPARRAARIKPIVALRDE